MENAATSFGQIVHIDHQHYVKYCIPGFNQVYNKRSFVNCEILHNDAQCAMPASSSRRPKMPVNIIRFRDMATVSLSGLSSAECLLCGEGTGALKRCCFCMHTWHNTCCTFVRNCTSLREDCHGIAVPRYHETLVVPESWKMRMCSLCSAWVEAP